jgi:tRNA A-37 threonylcarbamoyl transferase component Bud32
MENGRLGKYEIRGILGKGAMGTVYDGYDAIIDRRVAIKTLRLPDHSDADAQDDLARFRREAQAAGRLSHPNVVGVYDYGEDGTIAFIVMEYAPGTELKKILDKGERLPVAESVRIMEGLLAGLQYSHERGVVHRDIKPGNIILTPEGVVKIADFGIARIESSSMTQVGTIMGTPAYMSPEQFMAQTVDARTDLYSCGVLLYQLLTGELPFAGGMTAIMHKAINTEPPRPSDLSVTAPAALDPVVAKAMAKRPEHRFASAGAFAQAIREAMAGAIASPAGRPDDATVIARREPDRAPERAPEREAAPPSRVGPPGGPDAGKSAARTAEPKSRTALLSGVAVAVVLAGGAGAYVMLSGPGKPKPVVTAAALLPKAPVFEPQTVLPEVPPTQAVPAAPPPPAVLPTPPAVTPALPPVAPSLPPVALSVPAATAGMIRDTVSAALRQVACSLAWDGVDGRGVVVTGVAGRAAEPKLRLQVRDMLPANAGPDPVAWRLDLFDGPYCAVLDVVQPAVSVPLDLGLRNGARRLHKDEDIVPQVTMPDFPGWLLLDYFGSGGGVDHLHPSNLEPARRVAARSVVTLGDTARERWRVDAPFGTDMLVAIASSAPLFTAPRPENETVEAYLQALRLALADAARKGIRVAANVLLIDTSER